MEPFGVNERSWTHEEKEKVRTFLKYDHHVPLKVAHMVFSAEEEAEYFEKAGTVLAPIFSAAFYHFPIIRHQPVVRRALFALIPGYLVYKWGVTTKEDLVWGKTFAAWQKFTVYHGQHHHLFV